MLSSQNVISINFAQSALTDRSKQNEHENSKKKETFLTIPNNFWKVYAS